MDLELINFFSEDIELPTLDEHSIKRWLFHYCTTYNYEIEYINYIFCSDEFLLGINQQYLNHDYYTDIITFDNSEADDVIESDIYISLDRIKENTNEFNADSFTHELLRVIIHGLLHLIGFNDKSESEREKMRAKENECIQYYLQNY